MVVLVRQAVVGSVVAGFLCVETFCLLSADQGRLVVPYLQEVPLWEFCQSLEPFLPQAAILAALLVAILLGRSLLSNPEAFFLLQLNPEASLLLTRSDSRCTPLYPRKGEMGLEVHLELTPSNFFLSSPEVLLKFTWSSPHPTSCLVLKLTWSSVRKQACFLPGPFLWEKYL